MATSQELNKESTLMCESYDYDSYNPFPNFEPNLASYYETDFVPKINLEDFFLDEEDFDYCDHPFECCFPDYLDSLGVEEYIFEGDEPYLVLKHQLVGTTYWEDGTFGYPILPPFKTSSVSYFLPKAGEVMHRCLMAVAKGMDPDLPTRVEGAMTFRAESAPAASPDLTTEEQGTLVPTGPQPAAPAMSTLATAATGSMPDEWRAFFSYYSTINWSTTDEPGKVLFTQNLNPGMNVFIDHVSRMYSGWSGSMDVRFTISGSGVFGGKLAAVIVPPGISTKGGLGLLQFPHVLVDARQTDPVIFSIPDIRTVLYHAMTDSLTSNLVIVVYNELLNPYENGRNNSTSCTVTVESKPGADFELHLLKPPAINLQGGADPSRLISPRSIFWEGNRLPGQIDGFVSLPVVFQANRHFDTRRMTAGWSTPVHKDMVCAIGGSKDERQHNLAARSTIKESIPDGWPDVAEIGKEITIVDANANKESAPASFLATIVPDGSDHEIREVNLAAGVIVALEPGDSKRIAKELRGARFVMGTDTGTAQNYRLRPAYWSNVRNHPNPIGSKQEEVHVLNGNLPTAHAVSGNYPLFITSRFPGSFSGGGAVVYNSQFLETSRRLAEDSYDIGPDAFAVFRIKGSGGHWFDLGISSTGFFYCGGPNLPFNNLQFPLEARYVGIQSTGNRLQYNLPVGSTI